MRLVLLATLAWLFTRGGVFVFGQSGDKAGETQPVRVPADRIPPAPVLSAEQALGTFRLPPGFRIEIVAAEPLVDSPVAMAFDPDGRLFVVEMRGYMRNYEGSTEGESTGRIVILEDTDGDGRMDKRTVFLDRLVMPRALALTRGGVLYSEPPNLWFARDTNGDGVSDEKEIVAKDYAMENDPKRGLRSNPEHASNGLYWAIDNWIYSANHTVRFRNVSGEWMREPTLNRGQWGITQDDFGRLFFNSNSDHLRGDLIPSHYANRSLIVPTPPGLNVQMQKDQATWPVRVNPGVNRGYQAGQLREDGRLATFTGACGPVIYRGDNFPEEYRGNAFICEPTGNFIRRSRFVDKDGWLTSTNAEFQTEFLTSTDERFRPVNLYNGPDGALYVVDLARGLIQHRIYLTSYLRKQLESRNLMEPIDRGRIYRVVHDRAARASGGRLGRAEASVLVGELSSLNGWRRDTAQRLLIEKGASESIAPLKRLLVEGVDARARLHALWTLDGMEQLTAEEVRLGLRDVHAQVRRAALRLSERFLKGGQEKELEAEVLRVSRDPVVEVRWQAALSLSEAKGSESVVRLLELADGGQPDYVQRAALCALGGRELEAIRVGGGSGWWERSSEFGRVRVMRALSQALFIERKTGPIESLLETIGGMPMGDAKQLALLDGIVDLGVAAAKAGRKPRAARVDAEPAAFRRLEQSKDAGVLDRVAKIQPLLLWPGKAGAQAEALPAPLNAEERRRFETGRELYVTTCAVCHQPHGRGQDGLAPPLVDSEWVLGSEARLGRIVLHGVRGPIRVGDKTYELDMPGLGTMDDESLASILTYVRREWGHDGSPIGPEAIRAIRGAAQGREEAWTAEELLKLK